MLYSVVASSFNRSCGRLNLVADMRRLRRKCRGDSMQPHDGADAVGPEMLETGPSDVGDGTVSIGRGDIGSDEFQEPIMLDGISEDLQQRMYAVAPMLKGREGVYDERFFTLVCGLCNHGVEVDQVQTVAAVSDAEILTKWSPSSDKYRFAIDNCVDQDQAAQFCEHYRLVYGGHPTNSSFSMRFLRACYATFVHNVKVDWVAEAVKRHKIRMSTKSLNRHKLGPVAMREQLASLCAVVAASKAATGFKRSSSKRPKSPKLQRDQAIREVETALRDSYKLQEEAMAVQDDLLQTVIKLKQGLLSNGEQMSAIQEEYNEAYAVANELKLRGTNQLSAQKWREGKDLLEKLIEMSDSQQKTEESILVIETSKLPEAANAVERAARAIAANKEKLLSLQNFTLMLQTRAPFLYPTGTSLPELPTESKLRLCAGCGQHGFVACAIVVGSCGCGFHPTCIAVLLQFKRPTCPRCCTSFTGAWMAQFGLPLTAEMEEDVSTVKKSLEATAGGSSSSCKSHLLLLGMSCRVFAFFVEMAASCNYWLTILFSHWYKESGRISKGVGSEDFRTPAVCICTRGEEGSSHSFASSDFGVGNRG